MNKRGSHVGVILSFMIFITFITFMFFLLEPAMRIQKDMQATLELLEKEIKEEFSSSMVTFTIKIDPTKSCVNLQNLLGKDISSYIIDSHIIVKDESGKILSNVKRDKKDLHIEMVNVNNKILKIYHSEEFPVIVDGQISGCEKIKDKDYKIDSINPTTEIFEAKINKIKDEYDQNYLALKSRLNIPYGSDFGFSFTDKQSLIIETPQKEISGSVYVNEIPVLYVDNGANLKRGFITLRVWQ